MKSYGSVGEGGSSGNGGGGPSTHSGIESAANETTRNFILGLPKNGPAPGSGDAASLQAAEAFVGEIQQEIMAYDMANARAMEAYARVWWAKVPFFGKWYSASEVSAVPSEVGANLRGVHGMNVGDAGSAPASPPSSSRSRTWDHLHVERTSATATLSGVGTKNIQKPLQPKLQVNSWLFKRRHPGWVPLIQRWWVPFACFSGIVVVWTPDVWKLRTLYWCDYQYSQFRQAIHRAYWYATMGAEDYAVLIEDLKLNRPPSVKATDCPL